MRKFENEAKRKLGDMVKTSHSGVDNRYAYRSYLPKGKRNKIMIDLCHLLSRAGWWEGVSFLCDLLGEVGGG